MEDILSRMTLEQALQQLRDVGFDEIIVEQIKADGIGSEIVQEADIDDQRQVRLVNLLEFLRA